MNAARSLLAAEMEVVKEGMGHGDLSLEAYTQVQIISALNWICTHNVPLHFNLVQEVVSFMLDAIWRKIFAVIIFVYSILKGDTGKNKLLLRIA